jgi:hypothetical protein
MKGKLITNIHILRTRQNMTEWLVKRRVLSQHEMLKPMPYALMEVHNPRIKIYSVRDILKDNGQCFACHLTIRI